MMRSFCLALLLGLVCGAPALASGVLIVLSDSNAGVIETADSLAVELVRAGIPAEDIGRETAPNFLRTLGQRTDTRVYVTLGVDALREVLHANLHEPVVAALIPRSALERVLGDPGRHATGPVAALYLDQPMNRQLDLVRLALPEVRRLGLVLGPESMAQQASTVAAVRAHGMEAVVGLAVSADNLFAGLKPALEEADALLALPDSLVYNSNTVRSILMATYRARIPLIGFSPAYVRAGALLCVYSTPAQIAVQTAAMVNALLHGISGASSQYPQDFSVRVNDSVARSLGLSLREEQLSAQLHRLERKP